MEVKNFEDSESSASNLSNSSASFVSFNENKSPEIKVEKSFFDRLSCDIGSLQLDSRTNIFAFIEELKSNWEVLKNKVLENSQNFQSGRHTDLFFQHFFEIPYIEYAILLFRTRHVKLRFCLDETDRVKGKIIYPNGFIDLIPDEKGISTMLNLIQEILNLLTGEMWTSDHITSKPSSKNYSKKHRKKRKKSVSRSKINFKNFVENSSEEKAEPIELTDEDFANRKKESLQDWEGNENTKMDDVQCQKEVDLLSSESRFDNNLIGLAPRSQSRLHDVDISNSDGEKEERMTKKEKMKQKQKRTEEKNKKKKKIPKEGKERMSKEKKTVRLSNSLCENEEIYVFPRLFQFFEGCRFRFRWNTERENGSGPNFERNIYLMRKYKQKSPSLCLEMKCNTGFDESATEQIRYLLGDIISEYSFLEKSTQNFILFRKDLKKNFLQFVKTLETDGGIQFLYARRNLKYLSSKNSRYLTYECAHYLRSKICLTWSSASHSKNFPNEFFLGGKVLKYQSLDIRWTPAKDTPLNIMVCYGLGDSICMEGNSHSKYTVEINIHSEFNLEELQSTTQNCQSDSKSSPDGNKVFQKIAEIVKTAQTSFTKAEEDKEGIYFEVDETTLHIGQNLGIFQWDKASMTY